MKSVIAKYLLIFAIGFLTAFLITKPKDKKNGVIQLEGKTVIKVDTIFVPKPYPVTKYVTKQVPKPYNRIEIDTVYITSINQYTDTLDIEANYKIAYDITTIGVLDKIALTSIDNRPDKIIEKTILETKYASGLYIGGQADLKLNTAIGLQYHKAKNIVGVSVKLNKQQFNNPEKYNLSYHRRLF
jgi:hypothetical protein